MLEYHNKIYIPNRLSDYSYNNYLLYYQSVS
jgi:hypothetical protein